MPNIPEFLTPHVLDQPKDALGSDSWPMISPDTISSNGTSHEYFPIDEVKGDTAHPLNPTATEQIADAIEPQGRRDAQGKRIVTVIFQATPIDVGEIAKLAGNPKTTREDMQTLFPRLDRTSYVPSPKDSQT